MGSPIKERGQRGEGFYEDEPTTSGMSLNLDQVEMDDVISTYLSRLGSGSPDHYNAPFGSSETEGNLLSSPLSKNARHRPTKSTSSTPTRMKPSRDFSRYFSSKGKNGV